MPECPSPYDVSWVMEMNHRADGADRCPTTQHRRGGESFQTTPNSFMGQAEVFEHPHHDRARAGDRSHPSTSPRSRPLPAWRCPRHPSAPRLATPPDSRWRSTRRGSRCRRRGPGGDASPRPPGRGVGRRRGWRRPGPCRGRGGKDRNPAPVHPRRARHPPITSASIPATAVCTGWDASRYPVTSHPLRAAAPQHGGMLAGAVVPDPARAVCPRPRARRRAAAPSGQAGGQRRSASDSPAPASIRRTIATWTGSASWLPQATARCSAGRSRPSSRATVAWKGLAADRRWNGRSTSPAAATRR
jgi:hypothetical protein